MPALETLHLAGNPLGDEGLAALLAPPPPPPGGAVPAPAGVLTELKKLDLFCTKVTYANANLSPNLTLTLTLWLTLTRSPTLAARLSSLRSAAAHCRRTGSKVSSWSGNLRIRGAFQQECQGAVGIK